MLLVGRGCGEISCDQVGCCRVHYVVHFLLLQLLCWLLLLLRLCSYTLKVIILIGYMDIKQVQMSHPLLRDSFFALHRWTRLAMVTGYEKNCWRREKSTYAILVALFSVASMVTLPTVVE